MSKVIEETPVTTEAAKVEPAPQGADAFKAARASIAAQSTDQGPAEAKPKEGDDTSAKTPAEDPAKVADQPTEATDDTDALLTADEVAKLSPKERKLYDKAQKNYTLKTQKLAADRKEFDAQKPLMDALRANPMAALEEIAKHNGLTLSKAAVQDTNTVDTTTAAALAQLPEELQFLKPVFEQFGKTILATMKGELEPVRQAQATMVSAAAAAETEGTIKAFEASHPGWKKHESQMMEIGKSLIPTAGAMTDFQYMETLYKLATADMKKADQVKETVKQINKSASSVEPNTPGVADSRVEHAMPANWSTMNNSERMRASFEAAKNGIVFKK